MNSNIVPCPTKTITLKEFLRTREKKETRIHLSSITSGFFTILMKIFGMSEFLDLSQLLGKSKVRIIDIGAAGGFHGRWKQFKDNIELFLFEPNKEGFDELREYYQNDDRVRLFNTALSRNGEDLTIHLNIWPYSSSAFAHDQKFFEKLNFKEFLEPLSTHSITSKKLSDVIHDNIDFIKLDVEGYELAILEGSGNILDDCIGIELEVSYVSWAENLPLFGEVDKFCKEKKFILCELAKPIHYHFILPDTKLEAQGLVFSGDALYFRSPYYIVHMIYNRIWGSEKLKKALAVYLAYGNFEFAYVLLVEAEKKSIIRATDVLYEYALQLIKKRSGYKKIISRRKIKLLKNILRIPYNDNILDMPF